MPPMAGRKGRAELLRSGGRVRGAGLLVAALAAVRLRRVLRRAFLVAAVRVRLLARLGLDAACPISTG